MGIIACVEVTTTTTPASTSASSASVPPTTGPIGGTQGGVTTPPPPTSGTTVVPTSVATTTVCQKDMATIGGQYVSSVTYSVSPVDGTNNADLTSATGNGVDFPSVSGTTDGVLDSTGTPVYQITLTFNQPGVDSLGSITVNPNSNVDKFAVQFFVPSNPNQPVPIAPERADEPLSVQSTTSTGRTAILNFPSQLPSPISGIRIVILSTNDDQ